MTWAGVLLIAAAAAQLALPLGVALVGVALVLDGLFGARRP